MISREKLNELYDCVEGIKQRLFEIEKFWSLCDPCQNRGNCCHQTTTYATASEWAQIKKEILAMGDEDKETLRKNLAQNYECPFHSEDKCIIHDLRPINCRVLPYILIGGSEKGYAVLYGHGNCTEDERGAAILHLNVAQDVEFVKVAIPPRPEGVYYAVGHKIQGNKTFRAMIKEPIKSVSEWLNKEDLF